MLKSANCTKKSANCSRKQKKAVFYTIIIQENRIDIFNNRNRWVSYMQGRTVTEQYEKTWGRQPAVGKKIGNTVILQVVAGIVLRTLNFQQQAFTYMKMLAYLSQLAMEQQCILPKQYE